jgi:hypothetical protein
VCSLGQERDGIREIAADGLDHREAPQDRESDEKPTPAGVVRVAVLTVAVRVLVTTVPMRMLLSAVAHMVVIAVMLVRVRHGNRDT